MPPLSAVPVLSQFASGSAAAIAPAAALSVPVTVPVTSSVAVTNVPSCGVPAGLFLGGGLIPLPVRLVQRNLALEFVEMAKLVPEAWLSEATEAEGASSKCCGTSWGPQTQTSSSNGHTCVGTVVCDYGRRVVNQVRTIRTELDDLPDPHY